MSDSPLFGAIDLGSNSFHMLVVRQVHGAVRVVAKVKRKVRLASGLGQDNVLSREAMERGWDCLRLFAEQLQDIPHENIRIVGTATLRLAKNADTFVRVAEEILGHRVEVISGLEEAGTIYQGVSWTSSGEGNRLVIDIGGASTEVVLGDGPELKVLNSLPLGCVTWLNRYFEGGVLSSETFDQAVNAAKGVFSGVVGEYLGHGWNTCVGASGTVQALQEIMVAQGKSERVTMNKMMALRDKAIECGSLEKLTLEGLQPERLNVFPSGLAILMALFDVFAINEMTLAGGALREGLVYGMIAAANHTDRAACGDAQTRTVKSMISRYQIDAQQGQRVRETCVQIFSQLEKPWNLSSSHGGSILAWAAVLYELGLCIEYRRAPQHAAYIVENIDMPGFTPDQKHLLSGLLFNQRDEFKPDVMKRQHTVPFDEAMNLARILRFAIILCTRRTEGTIPDFFFTAKDGELTVKLPCGWLGTHYLRASEMLQEAKCQTEFGWPTKVLEDCMS